MQLQGWSRSLEQPIYSHVRVVIYTCQSSIGYDSVFLDEQSLNARHRAGALHPPPPYKIPYTGLAGLGRPAVPSSRSLAPAAIAVWSDSDRAPIRAFFPGLTPSPKPYKAVRPSAPSFLRFSLPVPPSLPPRSRREARQGANKRRVETLIPHSGGHVVQAFTLFDARRRL